MTGIPQIMIGQETSPTAGVVASFTRWQVIAQAAAGATSTANLTFKRDGSVTGTGSPTDETAPGTRQWYSPTGGTPGDAYWIRATNTGAALTGGAAVGTWLQLNVDRVWTMAKTSSISTATLKIEIATDAAGTNIVFTSANNLVTSDHLV